MNDLAALTRDYRVALLRYLPRREEAPLASGYELGRTALAHGVSILELARVHHDVLLDVLRDTRPDEVVGVAAAAADFFLEVLAAADMTHRGLRGATD
ncbi:MAG TPA: phosphatase RsbU N-terminal domain-containing protein [Intrasporangium sp.]|uniref:phosphatase RsbU N-terminal domain-containing protein n=1 Tax=Intrasporangium sp. TaxID=1925024 RepID=UPI002D78D972|nr:phosphatase RsbU N-terminal domain-containing protein [Intrasporangium sp.]HET7399994.1 phosphatase RsbU N-terminal domain-containing protein [Intrasporangium sp.]